jgi:hypothetical protein
MVGLLRQERVKVELPGRPMDDWPTFEWFSGLMGSGRALPVVFGRTPPVKRPRRG